MTSAETYFDEEVSSTTPDTELIVLALDGSGSMKATEAVTGITKADSVEDHILNPDSEQGLIARLQRSTRADSTQVAIVTFDHRVEVLLPITPVRDIDLPNTSLDLLARHGGRTAIGLALQIAFELGEQYLSTSDEAFHNYVTILLMSDGQNNEAIDPLAISEEIHNHHMKSFGNRRQMVVASAAYGDKAHTKTLRKVATQVPGEPDRFYQRVDTGTELRDFFLKSTLIGGD